MNSSRSFCLIVNSASNSGKAPEVIEKYRSEIESKLKRFEIVWVTSEDSITDIAKSKASSFDVVVACGGDGTIRKVAIGLIGSNAILGVLPIGTGNDFAKMLQLTDSFSENLHKLATSSVEYLDVIQFNDSYFINTLGIGYDGRTNKYASRLNLFKGPIKYLLAGIQSLFTASPFETSLYIDDKSYSYKTLMVIIANGKWEGGRYFISPESKNNDGIFEILVLENVSKVRLAFEFIRLSAGKKPSENIFKVFKTNRIKLNTSIPVHIHADGEVESHSNTFNIKLLEYKLKVAGKFL